MIDLPAYDTEHVWHPYSSLIDPTPTFPVASARGVYLELEDGRRLVDGMASWWAAIHGYNHPRLNAAVERQLAAMAHVMFGGLTHRPAVELAKKLIDLTAEPLQHVFFADSGSISVEVAIKMALQFWFAQGRGEKQRLLTVKHGYHGDSFATMALCDSASGFHGLFEGVLPRQLFAPPPDCSADGQADEASIDGLEDLLERHQGEVAAVILEPIVQGAGGMRIYCPEYLRRVRSLCDAYDVLLILDEIATGFGRTGTLFAYEQADVVPDILCLGKALTGGYMTLAATLASGKVAAGIGADGRGVLMHGPTFMANPLACSVANASIELLLESPWRQRVAAIEAQLRQELAPCRRAPAVHDVRVKGAIGVVELKHPVDIHRMQPRFVALGVWVRPFSNLVYLMPPFIVQPEELSRLTAAIGTVVRELP